MSLSTSHEHDAELRELIDANRARALWSLPLTYFPADREAKRRILERIASRGDRATWIRARHLLKVLSS